ncbi:glycosyl transferase, partial [Zychaea mexicana]|uniref:glycosyl transferase n=1 Tax=Zychaea mexicana TaxID=64656 RepID=UPI0022FF1995
FVTVGSTGFDSLVEACTAASFLNALERLGYKTLLIQYGSSESIFKRNRNNSSNDNNSKLTLQGYAYKPSITQDMEKASLVISHAGSGSILQALRIPKPLIVVSNSLLMDNHQQELAQAMSDKGYCICSNPSNLIDAVDELSSKELVRLPPPSTSAFANLLNTHMGF